MPTFFKINKIDNGYTWQDFDILDMGVEYATNASEAMNLTAALMVTGSIWYTALAALN